MNELKLLNIEIDGISHSIQYFKSNKDNLWFFLNDICQIMVTYYRLPYSDIKEFCKEFGKTNVCTSHSMYKTPDGEDVYIKKLDYCGVFVDFSTIDKLAKKYSDKIPYRKFDKLRDAIRDSFDEFREEITEEEIERRIEAVKKEIDTICKLQKAIKNKKK